MKEKRASRMFFLVFFFFFVSCEGSTEQDGELDSNQEDGFFEAGGVEVTDINYNDNENTEADAHIFEEFVDSSPASDGREIGDGGLNEVVGELEEEVEVFDIIADGISDGTGRCGGGECEQRVYSDCTCASDDPCGWSENGICDLACGDILPLGSFDDSADCDGDVDGDGLNDSFESQLAIQFEPYLWFSINEEYRKDRYPHYGVEMVDALTISIFYALSYYRDYGVAAFGGITSHPGDSEFIVVEVVEEAPGSWVFSRAFLSAHHQTITDSSGWYGEAEMEFELDDDGNFHPVVYVSEWKHANYPSISACRTGAFGFDSCSRGVLEITGVEPDRNVGSYDVNLIDEVVLFDNSEFYWTDLRFCGWQVDSTSVGERGACPSSYNEKIMLWLSGSL